MPTEPFPCSEQVLARVGKMPYVRFDRAKAAARGHHGLGRLQRAVPSSADYVRALAERGAPLVLRPLAAQRDAAAKLEGLRVEVREAREAAAREEALAQVADDAFDAALLVAPRRATGRGS